MTSSGNSLGEVGSNERGYYWKLPNGMIFQWGQVNLNEMNLGSFAGGRSNPLIITLPTSFQSANYYIKTSIWNKNNSYGVDYDFQIEHLEKGKAYLYGQEFNDGTSFVREYVDFFAIGQWNSSGSNLGEVGSNDKGYYWKLPNGLIFQWGITNDGKKGVDFPIPFKNVYSITKYSLQGTTQGNGLTGGLPPVRFSM